MTSRRGGGGGGCGGGSPTPPSPSSNTNPVLVECCMCGDVGLSFELFRCESCHFRSQHRYCSNLYPKSESYRLCNWCLLTDGSSSPPPPLPTGKSHGRELRKLKTIKLRNKGPPSPEISPPFKTAGGHSLLRRTKSEVGIGKHGVRNRVRRYKLLEEVVSS